MGASGKVATRDLISPNVSKTAEYANRVLTALRGNDFARNDFASLVLLDPCRRFFAKSFFRQNHYPN